MNAIKLPFQAPSRISEKILIYTDKPPRTFVSGSRGQNPVITSEEK